MIPLVVILMFVAFVAADIVIRESSRRLREKRQRREREAVLTSSVRLDFTHEARSLKRVEVPSPKARILAVDDEPVVLDSFRRILVLEGFSVDTVENGPEALGLVQRRDYDFVFTDLKMPGMDGVEVVKAVKHLRPDVDVVVITGYGSIETAIQTLQHGACEYVQKPFTADELADFVRKLVIKREARIEAQRKPTVRVVSPFIADSASASEYCVPGGFFISPGHVWVRIEASGLVRIGIDDFARKALGSVTKVLAPERGRTVRTGEPLFTLMRGAESAHFHAPLSGRVVQGSEELESEAELVTRSPYDRGWICMMEPADLAAELPALRIGKPLVEWYQEEVARIRKAGADAEPKAETIEWAEFERRFLESEVPAHA
jgi:CheY-like chemotaxis protein